MRKFVLDLDLQFFNGGAGGAAGGSSGAAGAAGGSASGGEGATAGNTGASAGSEGQAKPNLANEFQKIREKRFGKERAEQMAKNKQGAKQAIPAAAELTKDGLPAETQPNEQIDRKARFREMVDGEYKDLATEYHNEVFNKRYKQLNDQVAAEKARAEALTAQTAESQPLLEMLMTKHNVKSVADLQKAIEADSSYWEDGARENGMTVEAFKNHVKTMNELNRMKQKDQIQKTDEYQRQQFNGWYEQAQAVKEAYPQFDLINEIKTNETFHNLLKSNVPVADAYNVIHFKEITAAKEKAAADAAKEAYIAQLQGKQSRPAEAAIKGALSKEVKTDVKKLTPEDRLALAERSKTTGEKIRLS